MYSPTIYAVSTPPGAGGIGIIRVSGNGAIRVATSVFSVSGGRRTGEELSSNPMRLTFGIFHACGFDDKGYAVFIPAEKAYTGEDTVEFYLHGGPRIMEGALAALYNQHIEPAGAGEFTKRAYLNGRMSLSDAEGVADMINAESAAAARAAFRMMQGGISKKIDAIGEKLLNAISTLEASLDYPDEMEDEVLPELNEVLPDVLTSVENLLSTAYIGRVAKHGVNVVLAGEPNVGKSSILNALLGEDRAIVTPIAGTTRDAVTGSAEYDGVMLNFTDTAGLRESGDEVESIGIERAKKAMEGADVVVYVLDATQAGTLPEELNDTEKTVIRVYNKCDLTTDPNYGGSLQSKTFRISAKTEDGVKEIGHAIAKLYKSGIVESGDIITCERHVSALQRAKKALKSAIEQNGATIDCVLVDLRTAYDALGEITGVTAAEDVVDRIFSKFCVGK